MEAARLVLEPQFQQRWSPVLLEAQHCCFLVVVGSGTGPRLMAPTELQHLLPLSRLTALQSLLGERVNGGVDRVIEGGSRMFAEGEREQVGWEKR